jgi:hypothetical protein
MTQTDELFSLVKSLNKFEKGYVKKHLTTGLARDGDQMIRLLDAIAAQDEYDEAALKAHFSAGRSKSHFAVSKHTLYRRTLQALAKYQGKSSEFADLFDTLRCAEVLYLRGKHEEALSFLRDAESQLLSDGEREEEYLLVAKLRNRILAATREPFLHLEVRLAEVQQERHALKLLGNRVDYWEFFCKTENLSFNQGTRLSEDRITQIHAWLADPLLADASLALSPHAQINRLESLIRLHYHLHEVDQIEPLAREMLHLIERHPEIMAREWIRYQMAISFVHGILNIQLKLADALKWILLGFGHLNHPDIPEDKARNYSRGWFDYELRCLCRLGLTEVLRHRVGMLQDSNGQLPKEVGMVPRIVMAGNLAWSHLLLGNDSAANAILQEQFTYPYQEWMFDFHQRSRVILLCLVAQQGDTELLFSNVESYRRFVSNRKELNLFDKAVIPFFRNYQPGNQDYHAKFGADLRKLMDHPDRAATLGIHFFPLHLWAEAIAQKITFAQACAREYQPASEETINALVQLPPPLFLRTEKARKTR